MPIIEAFDKLESVPEEQITDKIGRRVVFFHGIGTPLRG